MKKEKKYLLIFSLIILCSTTHLHFATAGVTEGRLLLFNNGLPTYSGIVAANDEFKAAATDPTNQEANLFYAVTRILTFGLESGNGLAFETLKDVYESFGITRNTNDDISVSPIDMPPDYNGSYLPPSTIPQGAALHDFIAGPFLTLIKDAIDNLEKISVTFSTTLTPLETGGEAVSVDYYDVLLLKSILHTTQTFTEFITAYGIDSLDLHDLTVLINADVLQMQQDVIDKYQDFLELRTVDGAIHLSAAWTSLDEGIDAYQTALTFIQDRWAVSDFRETHLFFYDSQDSLNDAKITLSDLLEIRNSISENRAADFSVTENGIYVYDAANPDNYLSISIDIDSRNNMVNDGVWGLWDFLETEPHITAYTNDGTNTQFEISHIGSSCTILFDGALDDTGSFTGSWTSSDCTINSTGSFQGGIYKYKENEYINFNRVFGTNTNPPLNIREVLPTFDIYNQIVPFSFPPLNDSSFILNGIYPTLQTNTQIKEYLELEFSGFADVHNSSKTIDGSNTDWANTLPIFSDGAGDACSESTDDDLKEFYLAKDTQNLYFAFTLHDTFSSNPYLRFSLRNDMDGSSPVTMRTYSPDSGVTWTIDVYDSTWNLINSYNSSHAKANSGFLEGYIPLSDVYSTIPSLSGMSVTATAGCDYHRTNIRLNTSSINGSVSIPAATYSGIGKIFLAVYDGPNPQTSNLLSSSYIDTPLQAYTLTGIPISPAQIYVYAVWDKDDNGLATLEDYVWGKSIVADSGTITLNIDFQDALLGDRLGDTINILQILNGMNPLGALVGGDVNADGKLGLEEAIEALREAKDM